ncbi:MAG: outer membrane lipoprotein-sorting protein [Lentisphaerae bacterium]|nr:outer membrane lipoprotein-sorting protein [Lentisphaerota bacterium]
MRRYGRFWRRAALAALLAAGPATARDREAEELMRRVQLAMPEVPLEMDAEIRVLDRKGRVKKSVSARVDWTPRDGGRVARYVLLDAFGGESEEMTVELGTGGAGFSYARGYPLEPAEPPNLFEPIAETGISWMELSFSYFWWPGPRIVGAERVASRWDCQIIELDAPADYPGERPWSKIRLWVAPVYGAVMRGEVWQNGQALKRFEVQSVKKLRQVYMIGSMEVKNLETRQRTRLKVGRMKMVSPDYTEEELEELNAPITW